MKGKEREYSKKWIANWKLNHPGGWIYKVPDSPITRKPFDAVACFGGEMWAIEFKMADNTLTEHQEYELKAAKRAGAKALVIYFGESGEVAKEEYL